MAQHKYDFVWYGDGYYVYHNGKYIGRDEQLDLVEIACELGAKRFDLAERVHEYEEKLEDLKENLLPWTGA